MFRIHNSCTLQRVILPNTNSLKINHALHVSFLHGKKRDLKKRGRSIKKFYHEKRVKNAKFCQEGLELVVV